MISKDLIKSSFIYTVTGALPLVSAFFLLLFYTNYLTQSDYGAFVLYVSFTLFIQILVNFGLESYIGISYFDYKNDSVMLKERIGSIVAYLLVVGLIGVLIFLIIGKPLFAFVFKGKELLFFPYGFMSVVTGFFNSFFKTYTNLLINQQRPTRFAVVNLANFLMTIGFSLVGLFLYPFTLIGPMWGRLLSGAGIFLIALVSFRKEFVIHLTIGDNVKRTFSFAWPVVVFLLLSWVISNIYPWIMKQFMSLGDIAIFGLALQFTLLIEFTLNGLSSAFIPRVYELMKNENLLHSTPELNKYFSSFSALSLLIIPLATFILPLVMPLIIPKDYTQTYLFLSILNISFATRGLYNYFLAPIYFHKKTKILPKIYIYTATIQIVISIILIKHFGIWGAVWANLVTRILQNIFMYVESRKFFTYSFNFSKLVGLPFLVVMFIILSDYYATTTNIHFIHATQLIATFILVAITYNRELKQIQNWILSKR